MLGDTQSPAEGNPADALFGPTEAAEESDQEFDIEDEDNARDKPGTAPSSGASSEESGGSGGVLGPQACVQSPRGCRTSYPLEVL